MPDVRVPTGEEATVGARLNLSHGGSSADEAAGARGEKAARSGPVTAEIRELQGQLMRGLRKLIDATEDVGDRFAEEARRIHFDEAPDRPIRGVARPKRPRRCTRRASRC